MKDLRNTWNNLKEKDHYGDIGVYGKILLKRTLKRYSVRLQTGFNPLRLETNGRILYHGNELSGSVTENFLAN
jgi:hypothetical protein